ncbi:hypothetical protein D3C87_1525390 [compost metagenome]
MTLPCSSIRDMAVGLRSKGVDAYSDSCSSRSVPIRMILSLNRDKSVDGSIRLSNVRDGNVDLRL